MLAPSFHDKPLPSENPMKLPSAFNSQAGRGEVDAEVTPEAMALKQALVNMAPHLSKERASEVLTHLEHAISATRESAALKGVLDDAQFAGYDQHPYFHTAVGCVKQRLAAQQQQCFQEIHRICLQECFQKAWQTGLVQPGFGPGLTPGFFPGSPYQYPTAVPTTMSPMVPPALSPTRGRAPTSKVVPPPASQPAKVPVPQHMQKSNRQFSGESAQVAQQQFEQTQETRQQSGPEATDNRKPKVQTLATSLQVLSQENPQCIFIVRRINKLGFKAPKKLKACFSAYGPVVRVLVAHSTVRQSYQPKAQSRRRPSSLGFVQMRTPAAVQAILALGTEQVVDGVTISVQQFSKIVHDEAVAFEDDENGTPEDISISEDSPEICYQESPTVTPKVGYQDSPQGLFLEKAPHKIFEDVYYRRLESETTTQSTTGSDESVEDVGDFN